MSTNHAAVAALPNTGGADRTLLRNLLVARMPYVLADTDVPTDLVAVDPTTGAAIIDIVYLGRFFHYDPTDTTTANDGVSVLVSNEGRRYKLSNGADVVVYAVISNTVTVPPGSPALGDAYLVAAGATGAWAGHDGQVAVKTRRGWEFVAPGIGRLLYVSALDSYYHKNAGGTWTLGFGTQSLPANSVPAAAAVNFANRWRVENQTTNTPPGSPSVGVAYIVGSAPTGAWAGSAGKLAIWESAAGWTIRTPVNGDLAYDKALNTEYRYTGSAWASQAGAIIGAVVLRTPTNGTQAGFGTSPYYTYSDSTPPAVSNQGRADQASLSYTARKAGARLRITYQARVITVTVGVGVKPFSVGLFRDSDTNATDWQAIPLSCVNAGTETHRVFVQFEVTTTDANTHTYGVDTFDIDASNTITSITRRTLQIEEFA